MDHSFSQGSSHTEDYFSLSSSRGNERRIADSSDVSDFSLTDYPQTQNSEFDPLEAATYRSQASQGGLTQQSFTQSTMPGQSQDLDAMKEEFERLGLEEDGDGNVAEPLPEHACVYELLVTILQLFLACDGRSVNVADTVGSTIQLVSCGATFLRVGSGFATVAATPVAGTLSIISSDRNTKRFAFIRTLLLAKRCLSAITVAIETCLSSASSLPKLRALWFCCVAMCVRTLLR